MRFLKTNTATRVTVGPFYDVTDAVTPEVALTVTNEKLTFVVDYTIVPTLILDTAPTASGGDNDMVHISGDDSGFYSLELTAANTNYVGRAMLSLTDATNHLPVFHEFMILSAQAYDAMCGTGYFNADVLAISGDTTAADNCELMFDGTGYAGGAAKLKVDLETIKTQAVTCAGGVTIPAATLASTTNITGGTITTTTNLTNLPTMPANWLTASGLATDAVTEIQTGLATPTNITAGTITTVTNLTNAPTAGDLTATMKASITTAATAATPTVTISRTTGAVATDAGNAAGSFKTNLASAVDDFWKGAWLKLTSGALSGQVRKISAYNGTTKVVTVSPAFTGIPADAVTFSLVNE